MTDHPRTTILATREAVRDAVWTELLECYGEGNATDWPYLTDLCDLVVSLIERHGPSLVGDDQ